MSVRNETAANATVPVVDVVTVSYALSTDGTLGVVSFTDLPAADGCALSTSLDAAPKVAAHQVVATIRTAGTVCPSGVYPMGTTCAPTTPGAAGVFAECGEYRRWVVGGRAQTTVAASGTVNIQQTWIDQATADCEIDVSLTFGSGDTFSKTATVRVKVSGEGAPFCL